MTPSTLSSTLLATAVAFAPVVVNAGRHAPAGESADAPVPAAVEAFYRGQALFAEARYAEALEQFQRADSLQPAPDLQFNIGLCHARLEHWDDAIQAFEIYLRTKDNPPDRADIEARIAEAKRRREEARRNAVTEPEEPDTETRSASDEPVVTDGGTDAPGKPGRALIVSGSVLLGLGIAGAAGAVSGLGFSIASKNDELNKITKEGNPGDVGYQEARTIQADAEDLRTYQFIAVGVGAGVAVIGATLLGIGLKRRANHRAAAANATFGAWATQTTGGLTLRGSF